jgi:uncharacterized protein DUF5335
MQTRQIPKTEWPMFFERFSQRHEGWLVKLEIFDPEIGAQVEGTGLILEGLTDEYNEMTGNTIMIMAGNTPEDHLTHSISHPTEVSLGRTDGGADQALSIKSADGTTALLSFRSAVLPEMVDSRESF